MAAPALCRRRHRRAPAASPRPARPHSHARPYAVEHATVGPGAAAALALPTPGLSAVQITYGARAPAGALRPRRALTWLLLAELSEDAERRWRSRACPCAEWRELRGADEQANGLTLLAPEVVSATAEVRGFSYVGRYGIKIEWGDGHDHGIYTFEFFRELAG